MRHQLIHPPLVRPHEPFPTRFLQHHRPARVHDQQLDVRRARDAGRLVHDLLEPVLQLDESEES